MAYQRDTYVDEEYDREVNEILAELEPIQDKWLLGSGDPPPPFVNLFGCRLYPDSPPLTLLSLSYSPSFSNDE